MAVMDHDIGPSPRACQRKDASESPCRAGN